MRIKLSTVFRMALKGTYEYIIGHICVFLLYKRKYIYGKYFKGSRLGFMKIGWGWAIADFNARVWLRINKGVPFPISPRNHINNPENIFFDSNDLLIFQGQGKYFQAVNAPIHIGKGCYIADNVGIITTNHDIYNLQQHVDGSAIYLGDFSWVGMNSIILPGVTLGNNTIVGAGSVVTKSFPDGYCVIAGNPAKIIRKLERNIKLQREENIE